MTDGGLEIFSPGAHAMPARASKRKFAHASLMGEMFRRRREGLVYREPPPPGFIERRRRSQAETGSERREML